MIFKLGSGCSSQNLMERFSFKRMPRARLDQALINSQCFRREIVELNDTGGVIKVVHGKAEDIELPEQVDIIVRLVRTKRMPECRLN